MRTTIGRLLITLAAVAVWPVASSASAPTWTFGRRAVGRPGRRRPAASAATRGLGRDRPGGVRIRGRDPRVRPRLQASRPDASQRPVRWRSPSSTTARRVHNITFADGTALTADAGKTATGTVNVPAAGL